MQAVESSLQDGQILFDKYEVERFLGKGSFGEVYLVNDSSENVKKALKIIFNRNLETDTSTEIDLLKMIDCPNVIKYYDHILHERKMFYFFIEYCSGGDLKQVIDKASETHTKIDQILDWSLQILNGIQYLHSRSIIHRDIKPENIFIGEGDVLKIGDLGIARDLHSFTRMGNTFAGTDYYMSPEIINQEQYNEKIDVWSYGCVVYEMLTLQKAFNGKNQPAVFEAILKSEPVIPSHPTPEILMIIKNCLKKKQNDRVSSVQLFALLNKTYTTPERINSARSLSGWEPPGICVRVITGHKSPTQALIMGPDDMLISGSVDDTIKLWNLDSGECLRTLEVDSPTNTMAISQDGYLISGDNSGSIKVWDLKSGEMVKSVREYRFSIMSLLVTKNNQLITGSDNYDGRIKVWNLDTLETIRVMNDHEGFIKRMALKDELLISGARDTTIRLYNVNTGECLRTLSDHKDMIMALTITREGHLASGSGDGHGKIWDLESGVCIRDLGHCSNGFVTSLLGNRGELIYSSWDTSIKFMDTRSGKVIKTIQDAHKNAVYAMAVDKNGRLITGAGDTEIKVWEI